MISYHIIRIVEGWQDPTSGIFWSLSDVRVSQKVFTRAKQGTTQYV